MENGDITKELIKEGIFFQISCAERLRKIGWVISQIELPFTYPPSLNAGMVSEKTGVLDILSFNGNEKQSIVAVIECKQANKEFKAWIFFPFKNIEKIKIVQTVGGNDITPIRLFGLPINSVWSSKKSDFLHYDCREISLKDSKISNEGRWRGAERIHTACNQVSHTFISLISQKNRRFTQYPNLLDYLPKSSKNNFFPIVITTAKLYSCEYDAENVSLEGEIPLDKVKYTEMPWVIYEFPLPDYMQLSFLPDCRGILDIKRYVFIVNSEHLESFFKDLEKAVL